MRTTLAQFTHNNLTYTLQIAIDIDDYLRTELFVAGKSDVELSMPSDFEYDIANRYNGDIDAYFREFYVPGVNSQLADYFGKDTSPEPVPDTVRGKVENYVKTKLVFNSETLQIEIK